MAARLYPAINHRHEPEPVEVDTGVYDLPVLVDSFDNFSIVPKLTLGDHLPGSNQFSTSLTSFRLRSKETDYTYVNSEAKVQEMSEGGRK